MAVQDRFYEAGRRVLNVLQAANTPADVYKARLKDDLEPPKEVGPQNTARRLHDFGIVGTGGEPSPLTGADNDAALRAPFEPAPSDPKALYWDPFALVEQLGYKEKPTSITYGTQSAMVQRMPIIQSIIQTRLTQGSAFCTPQLHPFEPGFRIKMRDAQATPTKAATAFMRDMERNIIQCGTRPDIRYGDTFESFFRKILRDSLVYDQCCFEVVPGRNGRPAEWYAVDAATIRRADTRTLFPDDKPGETTFVQIYDNTVIAEFSPEEMAFGVRNPRTDIRLQQYGTSELEMLVTTITSLLFAWNYNQNFFTQGTVAKGILNIVGSIPEKQLRAFRRLWYQQISGVENAWRTPITNAEKIEWHNLQQSNRDMEFSAWMDFLIKVACAIYQIDPMELGFKYGSGSSGGKALFDTGNKARLTESKDRGLRPLLRFLARELDKMIIFPTDPDFTFEFVGLDAMTPKEKADLQTQRVRSVWTINEVRKEDDLPPVEFGDRILDPTYIGMIQMKEQMEMQKEQQEEAAAAEEAQAQAQAEQEAAEAEADVSELTPEGPDALLRMLNIDEDELEALNADDLLAHIEANMPDQEPEPEDVNALMAQLEQLAPNTRKSMDYHTMDL